MLKVTLQLDTCGIRVSYLRHNGNSINISNIAMTGSSKPSCGSTSTRIDVPFRDHIRSTLISPGDAFLCLYAPQKLYSPHSDVQRTWFIYKRTTTVNMTLATWYSDKKGMAVRDGIAVCDSSSRLSSQHFYQKLDHICVYIETAYRYCY
jgi:hypothetical protein